MLKPCQIHNREAVNGTLQVKGKKIAEENNSRFEIEKRKYGTTAHVIPNASHHAASAFKAMKKLHSDMKKIYGNVFEMGKSLNNGTVSMTVKFIDETFNKLNEHAKKVKPSINKQGDLFDSIKYQLPSNKEEAVASEKTIRDLAARMSDRIGIEVRFISDRSEKFKGKLENNIAIINLAYATLDTPIHEILGHPIVRVLKNKTNRWEIEKTNSGKYSVKPSGDLNISDIKIFDTKEEADYFVKNNPFTGLYNNLLKELETSIGKEVLDRIKRDYVYKVDNINEYKFDGIYYEFDKKRNKYYKSTDHGPFGEATEITKDEFYSKIPKYTLEEQQEEAIVELLGLYTAGKLNEVKDGKLISLLKRLLKEMKSYMKSLFNAKEINIDSLPDNMSLDDLADLLAYKDSKILLPGYSVLYITPDNQTFKTYQEASNHISNLTKLEKVNLDSVNHLDGTDFDEGVEKGEIAFLDAYPTLRQDIIGFIHGNKQYEQSKELIEEWKKINDIKYDPEEIYSRGQEFVSIVGAYSDFDLELMFQNLLIHIEDNKKAGGEFVISALTRPVNKRLKHVEGIGSKIRFKIYPKSDDIKWAANSDVYSGSVWDASQKISKGSKSETMGVSYTKYPVLTRVTSVQPNLVNIIDDLAHSHNELGIELNGDNFRLEYDEDVPYSTKKIIDSINSILDQKYGKIVKPEIKEDIKKVIYNVIDETSGTKYKSFDTKEEANDYITKEEKGRTFPLGLVVSKQNISGKEPTQTNKTLKVSIEELDIYNEENKNKEDYEYDAQARINAKIAALKKGQRKFPRSLIRSEVVRTSEQWPGEFSGFEENELPFQKIQEPVTNEQQFFQIANNDTHPVNKRLNKKLKDILKAAGINVMTITKYQKWYKERTGNEINAVAVADILQRIIAVNEGKSDITTLPEEVAHFIVEASLGDPEMQSLLALPDSLFMTHPEYNDYFERYSGDKNKVNKEILAKWLAGAIINNENELNKIENETRRGRIRDLLNKVLKFFFRRFYNNPNITTQILPLEVEEELGVYARKLFEGNLNLSDTEMSPQIRNKFQVQFNTVIPAHITSVNEVVDYLAHHFNLSPKEIRDNTQFKKVEDRRDNQLKELRKVQKVANNALMALKTRVSKLEERRLGLLSQELKIEYNELKESLGTDIAHIKETLELLTVKQQSGLMSATENQMLEEMERYMELHSSHLRDINNIRRIKDLRLQINKLNKEISDGNYDVGVFALLLGTETEDGYSGGAFDDIASVLKTINAIKDKSNPLTAEEYLDLVDFFKYYDPWIGTLKNLFFFGEDLDISPAALATLKTKLSETVTGLSEIKLFIKENTKTQFQNIMKELSLINPDIDINSLPSDFEDIGFLLKKIGSLQFSNNPIVAYFHKTHVESELKFRRTFIKKASNLLNDVKPRIERANKELASTLKKYGFNTVLEAMMERDSKGEKTGNFLNAYDTNAFNESFEKGMETAVKNTMQYAVNQGYDHLIPSDPELAKELFKRLDLNEFAGGNREAIEKLQKQYRWEKAKWFNVNTMARPNIEQIKAERRSQLSETQYRLWEESNIKSGINMRGEPYYYYVGELSIPSDGSRVKNKLGPGTVESIDHRNSMYEQFINNPDFKYVLEKLHDSVVEQKHQLGIFINYSQAMALPQIGKSTLEAWKTSVKTKGGSLTEKLGDMFLSRKDDELVGVKREEFDPETDEIRETLVKKPIVRYIGRLDDPQNISDDLLGTVGQFLHMAERNKEYSKVSNKLLSLIEVAKNSNFKTSDNLVTKVGKKLIPLTRQHTADNASNVVDRLQKDINRIIFGQTMTSGTEFEFWGKKWDSRKILNTLANFIRVNNLLGNYTSMVTGLMSASIDSLIEASIERDNSVEDYLEAKKIVAGNALFMTPDFTEPVKKNIISVMLQQLGILEDPGDAFRNLNIHKGARSLAKTINYGGWRFMDAVAKSQAVVATALNIRFDPNTKTWKTKYQFIQEEGDLESWKEFTKLYDMMKTNNGVLEFTQDPNIPITERDVLLWSKRSIRLSSFIDQQATEFDHGTIKADAFGQFLTIHMSWLFQSVQRRFSPKNFNYVTEQYEEGYYNSLYRFAKEILQPHKTLNIVNEFSKYADDTQRYAAKKIMGDIVALSGVYTIAYLLMALSNGDDDDDFLTEFSSYIATRLIMERSAGLSLEEFLQYVDNPVAGIDKVAFLTNPISWVFSLFEGQEERDTIKSGMYKGYSKEEQGLIKSIPGLRGFYETAGGGYINELTGKGSPTVGTSLKGKNRYLRDMVLNKNDLFNITAFPFVYPLTKLIVAGAVEKSTGIKNKDLGDLPTKKSMGLTDKEKSNSAF